MKFNFSSLRTKMIVLLTGITLVTALVLTINSVNTFKKDKIAYIFENNNLIISTASEKFRRELGLSSDVIKNYINNFVATGNLNSTTSPFLTEDSLVEGLEILQYDNLTKKFAQIQALRKEKFDPELAKGIVNLPSKIEVGALAEKQRVYIIENRMVVTDQILSNDKIYLVIYYFVPESFGKLFSEQNPYFTFLIRSNGEFLKSTDKTDSDFMTKRFDFFNDQKNLKRTLNSSTTKLQSRTGESWLISSVSLGFSNMYLLAAVNEKTAMSVLDGFYLRSGLMFLLITSLVIILGLLAATYLTGRLSVLSEATEKIADGDFSIQVNESGQDEIATLSSSFNKMTKQMIILMSQTAEKARMESELKTAQTVQSTLFPKSLTSYNKIDIAGVYKSASECGGDWWHHAEVGGSIWIWIADATGHGVPAALLTSAAKSAVTLIEKMNLSPNEAMTYLNNSICSVSNSQMMMTCFVAQLELSTLKLKYVNASHEAPIILRGGTDLKKKDLIFLTEETGARLGQSTESKYKVFEFQLEKGDRILLYSDGIPDITSPDNEVLGERGFFKYLMNSHNLGLSFFDMANDFHNKLENFRQKTELVDDVTYCFIGIPNEF